MTAKLGADTARRWGAIIGVHLAVVVVWYLVVKLWEIPKFVIASPTATFMSLFDSYPWFQNTVRRGHHYCMVRIAGDVLESVFQPRRQAGGAQ